MNAVKDHLGNTYASKSEMCRAWGLTVRTVDSRLSSGWTTEQALTTPLGGSVRPRRRKGCQPVCDHLGAKYPSAAAMCSHWSIGYQTYLARRLRGWNLKDALETPPDAVDHAPKACQDHVGNQYPDVGSMCKAWGIHRSTYYHRIQDNWSTEAALTTPVTKRARAAREQPCLDHLGNRYDSIALMCAAYGVQYNTFYARRKRGLSTAQALGTASVPHP